MLFKRFTRTNQAWPRQVLVLILLFAFFTRLYNVQFPENYYFDEVYHAMTAKLVARNDPRAYEWTHGDTIEPNTYVEWLHPPMAKYAQAAMINLVGENAVGWRLSSVFFGVGVILMTTLLAERLFTNRWLAILSGGLAALDGLLLAQSRIAMNDIHVVFGFLATLYAYLWYRQKPRYWRLLIVGAIIGLTIATKWSGAFVWAIVLLFEAAALLQALIRQWLTEKLSWMIIVVSFCKQSGVRIVALIILPLLIYVGSYLQMFLQGKDLAHFYELHQQIFWYQLHLDAQHPYQSKPLEWVLDLRPVWYFVEYFPNNTRADIYNTGNPFIYWGGLVAAIATVSMLGSQLIATTRKTVSAKLSQTHKSITHVALALFPMKASENTSFSLTFLLASYLICWVPWLFSPRIMFSYHYAPAVPLLSILIAFWVARIWSVKLMYHSERLPKILRLLTIIFLIGSFCFFLIWYPQAVAIPIASSFKDAVYFAFPSWR
ncbi:phospholipid carrier-dependent glycosyltransferase [Candidatus Woesebacteria bacterium]|nr:phospholipid carrier-dependent glycosyltransferase [Candidatus Woesebacteria bacterium]